MKLSKCDLCGEQGQLKAIADKHNLDTLSFLKNSDEISEAKLCSKCQEKVQIIAEIKQESKKEVSAAVIVKEDTVDDDDVNLEELDLLSRYVCSCCLNKFDFSKMIDREEP